MQSFKKIISLWFYTQPGFELKNRETQEHLFFYFTTKKNLVFCKLHDVTLLTFVYVDNSLWPDKHTQIFLLERDMKINHLFSVVWKLTQIILKLFTKISKMTLRSLISKFLWNLLRSFFSECNLHVLFFINFTSTVTCNFRGIKVQITSP